MPTRFLSDAEIERLERFPEAIEDRDLARFFRLDGEDLGFVRRQHSAAGQLGMRCSCAPCGGSGSSRTTCGALRQRR